VKVADFTAGLDAVGKRLCLRVPEEDHAAIEMQVWGRA
jgi:hypothetical protein